MRILWLTWKDKKHPTSGGAEVVNEELAKRLVKDGYEVIFLVSGFEGCTQEEMKDGYKIVRMGNRWTVCWKAFRYYKQKLQNWPDLVIDEINTVPFLAKFYSKQKNILFVHQLCREIWFYQMFFPLNIIGFLLEPVYLWLLNDRKVITVSESTKHDLMRFGFKEENISIISKGIEIEPIESLSLLKKFEKPTLLSLGAFREMKRTDHIIKAFEIAKESIPELRLILAGDSTGSYGEKILDLIKNSKYTNSISYAGKVSVEKKIELYRKSHLLCVTSVKEGWGLVVTEANSQGLPAVVYDVDGLRDSVIDGVTGIVCRENTPESMVKDIVGLLNDASKMEKVGGEAWKWSKEMNFNGLRTVFRENII